MVALTAWLLAGAALAASAPEPPGRMVDVGGHRLHLNCTGRGSPVVVIETGLGDFSFDWILVQRSVASFTRVCTYDRAGYAWSEPGPLPRTFDQLNFELREALARAGEHTPLILVGHSFGGGVVRHYAEAYSDDVAGVVFVDIVSENQFIPMGPRAGRIGDDARNREIPKPTRGAGRPSPATREARLPPIEPPYDVLPKATQQLHAWASSLLGLDDVEDDQKAWSAEYYGRWLRAPQAGVLGDRPLVVLTRREGGYGEGPGMSAAELERIRLESQRALATLSTNGSQRLIDAGHNMHLQAPEEVVRAIRDVVSAAAVRFHKK